MTNLKKYTNADFYKNGVFQQEIAIEAMKEMFVHYNIPFTGFMAENMWVTDFGLGDFENVGIRLCPNSLTVRFASGHLFDSFLQLRLFIRIFQHIHKVVGVRFGRNICRIRFISFHEILGVFRQVFSAVDI